MGKSIYDLIFKNEDEKKEETTSFIDAPVYRFSRFLFVVSLLKNLFIFGVFYLPFVYAIGNLFPDVTFSFFGLEVPAKETLITLATLTLIYLVVKNIYLEAYVKRY